MGCEDRMSATGKNESEREVFFLVLDLHIRTWWGV